MPAKKRDVSDDGSWDCPDCPYRHDPKADCPLPGVWLVLAGCPNCVYLTGAYCRRHARPGWR
jgi:hypothetical protein